jgi:hypothetical protein
VKHYTQHTNFLIIIVPFLDRWQKFVLSCTEAVLEQPNWKTPTAFPYSYFLSRVLFVSLLTRNKNILNVFMSICYFYLLSKSKAFKSISYFYLLSIWYQFFNLKIENLCAVKCKQSKDIYMTSLSVFIFFISRLIDY